MAAHGYADHDQPSPLFLLVDALAFLVRHHLVFWIAALPTAGLAAALAYVLDANQQFAEYRNHLGWDFLFALIYALFLDRWIKETLLDGASDCDEVDNLRRSVISPRFLGIAVLLFALAMALDMIELQGITGSLERWHLPHALAAILGLALSWLPHVFVWAVAFTFFSLMLPALSAAEPVTSGGAARSRLFGLLFGLAVVSLVTYAATQWGLEVLPKKPWAAAAMAAAWRFVDCLLLAIAGYVLATVWRGVTDWQQPEPEDHPYRGMGKRARRA